MSRLPTPGGDQGTWGNVLNDFLAQSHNNDGTLKSDSIGAAQLQAGSVGSTSIADDAITAAKLADDSVAATSIQAGVITDSHISASAAISVSKLSGLGDSATRDVGTAAGTVAAGDAVVYLAGTQTVTGDKAFTGAITVPTPMANTDAANKQYVDGLVDDLSGVTDASAARTAIAAQGLADWADDGFRAITERAPEFDVPTATWSSDLSLTDLGASPVTYRPVICGTGSAVSNWNGQSTPTDPNFFFHRALFETGNGGSSDLEMHGMIKPGGNASFARWPMIVEFITSAAVQELEVLFYGGGTLRTDLLVDVGWMPAGSFVSQSDLGNSRKVRLTFPVAGSRRIRLYLNGNYGFYGVRVPNGATISKPSNTITRRIAGVGDSWINGSGSIESGVTDLRGANNRYTYFMQLANCMGAQEIISAGIGGTGFVAGTDGGSPANYVTRLATVLTMSPTALIFQGSINDPQDGSGVQAAVEACLAATDSVSERYVTTVMMAGWEQCNTAIRAAVTAHGSGVQLIEMEGLIYGTGNALNGGTGNRAVFMRSDGSHPSYQGHRLIARHMFRRIAPLMP